MKHRSSTYFCARTPSPSRDSDTSLRRNASPEPIDGRPAASAPPRTDLTLIAQSHTPLGCGATSTPDAHHTGVRIRLSPCPLYGSPQPATFATSSPSATRCAWCLLSMRKLALRQAQPRPLVCTPRGGWRSTHWHPLRYSTAFTTLSCRPPLSCTVIGCSAAESTTIRSADRRSPVASPDGARVMRLRMNSLWQRQ